jgi:hypothetical protein
LREVGGAAPVEVGHFDELSTTRYSVRAAGCRIAMESFVVDRRVARAQLVEGVFGQAGCGSRPLRLRLVNPGER